MEGRYEGRFGSEIKLRTANRVLWVKMSSLTKADRLWVEKYEAAKEAAAKEAAAEKKEEKKEPGENGSNSEVERAELPVFDDGDWRGYHAGYSAKKYDAYLDARGDLWVHPKEDGERVGKGPMRLHLDCFARGEGTPYMAISVKGYQDLPRPEEQPTAVKLEMVLDRDVPFTVSYHFSEEGIRIEGAGDEPRTISPPTIYRARLRVPASHTWEDFDTGGGEEVMLKGWRIVTKSVDRETETFGFGDPAVMGGQLKKVEIDAPLYGERRVSIEADDPESAW
ncbi:MAG TPA: hypothetical protein VJ952_07875, partial [Opitutales bacterium]|nr:hypothetical protein [Opitutales bacterium]